MMAGAGVKAHTAAVALVPPAVVWPPIQAVRCICDKSFVRWPPHINLLYPFFQDSYREGGRSGMGGVCTDGRGDVGESGGLDGSAAFHSLAIRTGIALSHVGPFRVRLERLRTFRHSARSLTLWAEPSVLPDVAAGQGEAAPGGGGAAKGGGGGAIVVGSGKLLVVQQLLEAEFPQCSDLSRDEARGIDGFVPHLSLGQLRHEDELQALQAAWQPLEFEVDSVQLISRQGYLSPFAIRYHVPLGLGLDPDLGLGRADSGQRLDSVVRPKPDAGRGAFRGVVRLDVPYVATMACLASDAGSEDARQDTYRGSPVGLVRRFASPCLVIPPAPTAYFLPSQQTEEARIGGSADKRVDGTADTAGLEGEDGESRSERTTARDTGYSSSHGGGHVWWFAYGCAVAAQPLRVGALQSVPARLQGYRLAFNRRGGRANIIPDAIVHSLEAADRPRGSSVVIQGSLASTAVADRAAASATSCATGGEEAGPSQSRNAAQDSMLSSSGVDERRTGGGNDGFAPAGGCGCGDGDDGEGEGGISHARGSGPAGGLAEASPAVHGVLHLLPVDAMARLSLAVGDVCPVEVRCMPYGRAVTHGRRDRAGGHCGGGGSGGYAGAGDDYGTVGSGSDGMVVAVAFTVPLQHCLVAKNVLPTEGYLAKLRQSYDLYDIDSVFKEWLRRVVPVPDAAAREPEYHTGAGGRALAGARSSAWRTGAKKAAGGLPLSVTDW